MTPGTIANDAVLVLDAELERRIAAAALVLDVAPTEFIVRAVQQRCAEVLGEQWRSAVSPDTRAVWAIRPTPTRVLQIISDVSRVPIETVVGPGRGRSADRARTVVAYLLHHDAGLSVRDTARILHRKTPTVSRLTADVERVLGSSDPRTLLLERARRLFRNGLSSGKQYPPLGPEITATRRLPGLLAGRARRGRDSTSCKFLEDSSCSARVVAFCRYGSEIGGPSLTPGRGCRTTGRRSAWFRADHAQRALSAPASLLSRRMALLVEVAHPLGHRRLPRLGLARDIF